MSKEVPPNNIVAELPSPKSLFANVITEHYGFSPETFTKQGMDLANISMYEATAAVEKMLKARLEERGEVDLDEHDIEHGVYRLETLLESAIDKQFDKFELYLLRNTFQLKDDSLLPYIQLTHQDKLDTRLTGLDKEALEAYQVELQLYEEELTKGREIACADGYIRRKVEAAERMAQDYGYMAGADQLGPHASGVVSQLGLLQDSLALLLDTPVPPPMPKISSHSGPWGASRSAFVNWAARTRIDALPPSNPTKTSSAELQLAGSHEDAQDLFMALAAP